MLPIDGHVHFHEPKLVAPTLRAAAANFRLATGQGSPCRGALLLTQARTEFVFEWLREQTRVEEWSVVQDVEEPQTLHLSTQDGTSLAVIDGRQIRTERGLELLALGTRERFRDGEPMGVAAAAVCASGALAVIPWGFGKWTGARGRVVRTLLGELDPEHVCLGDNGGRVGWLPEPAILRYGRDHGYRILPGSDPFPFADDCRRVGRFGFLLDVEPVATGLWRSLRSAIVASAESPRGFGQQVGPGRFVLNNVLIQVRRLVRGAAA